MLGQDVFAAAQAGGHETVALPRAELDIADRESVHGAIAQARPEVIVNCAAWTDVDGAEEQYEAALSVNGTAAGYVAAAGAAVGAWTLHVSSDYVFAGGKREPYLESDAVAPASGYGRSKLAGEREVAQAAPGSHTVVRSSWLFGANGHCFPRTIARLAAERDELRVVSDQIGCPTFTGHLAEKLLDLAAQRRRGILHEAATGRCSWNEFAQAVFAAAGLDVRVTPTTSDALARPAPRPAWSVLASERDPEPMPAWQEGLAAYLALAPIAVAQ